MVRLEDLQLENLKIYQDDSLYTFTSDAVILSKFAKVKSGDIVADFCSGSGIVGLHLYALNKEKIKSVTFFEYQTPLFELSNKTINYNNLGGIFSAVNCKVQEIDNKFNGAFSLITCNPPYMESARGESAKNDSVAICKTEIALTLEELIKAFSKNLKFGGRVNMVHRADRLCDIICLMRKYGVEPKTLQTVSPKNKQPYLVLIEGVKGGKPGLKILKDLKN